MKFGFGRDKAAMISEEDALPGRAAPTFSFGETHAVLGTTMVGPWPDGAEQVVLGLGCFWGAERVMWQLEGVHTTAVGYSAGLTPHPTYEEVCSGRTGHNEVVLVVFDPAKLPLSQLLSSFWEGHNPTHGMRQGNDVGTQYRSGIYTSDDAQLAGAEASRESYARALSAAGLSDTITTEIIPASTFFYAEDYHQQYLHKVPNGYCGLGGTGVTCPIGIDGVDLDAG